jgi:hypothetical protein
VKVYVPSRFHWPAFADSSTLTALVPHIHLIVARARACQHERPGALELKAVGENRLALRHRPAADQRQVIAVRVEAVRAANRAYIEAVRIRVACIARGIAGQHVDVVARLVQVEASGPEKQQRAARQRPGSLIHSVTGIEDNHSAGVADALSQVDAAGSLKCHPTGGAIQDTRVDQNMIIGIERQGIDAGVRDR